MSEKAAVGVSNAELRNDPFPPTRCRDLVGVWFWCVDLNYAGTVDGVDRDGLTTSPAQARILGGVSPLVKLDQGLEALRGQKAERGARGVRPFKSTTGTQYH